ncbi:hypothetical protein Tco_1068386 [Tanacetum coccineum]|uniref:Retrovirus-related Pol polyprotein from transposon TNT 1-94 n=1 Tax=Tanacetum coccineum TaxID=301880 RepID=A0ABQ5HH00_9ASTR
MVPSNNLGHDHAGKLVNETLYRGMIGSLMYLTVTRPDIQFSTVLYARYQSNPKESHLIDVKRILRYLKGTPSLGLWYLKFSGFDLKGYSDSDYAGCNMDRKSTLVMNGKKPLILDYKTFVESIRFDYAKDTYVSHPSPEAVKAELAKIIENPILLDNTHVLSENYSFTKQVNSIQQLIAYCLLTRTKVDIGEIIYSDLITRFTNKSRQRYVSYPRFVSCALEVLLSSDYTQDESFGSPPTILMIPLPFTVKKKKGKSQTMTPTLPQSQGPEASEEPEKKRQTQLTIKGLHSPLDEGTHTSKPLLEGVGKTQPPYKGTNTRDKDLEGLKPLVDMEPSPTLVSDPLGTDAKHQVDQTQSTLLLSDDEILQESDANDVLEPESSHAHETDESDSDSSCLNVLKKYDNILPLTKRKLVKYLKNVSQDAIKEDSALNKKVLKSIKAYTKNSSSLTKLLSLVNGFNFPSFKTTLEDLQATTPRQDEKLAAWNHLLPWPRILVLDCHPLNSLRLTSSLICPFTPSYTKGEHVDMEANTEKTETDKDEEELARRIPHIPPLTFRPLMRTNPEVEMMTSASTVQLTDTTLVFPTSHNDAEIELIKSSSNIQLVDTTLVILSSGPDGILTDEQLEALTKLVKASSAVCLDLDAPIKIPYEIYRKLYNLKKAEIQEHLNKEENLKKAKEALMTKIALIKVVHKKAEKIGLDPKNIKSAKGGEQFKKVQDVEL